MSLNNSENIGQTDAGPLKILGTMKPFEQIEQLVIVLHVKTCAIVPDRKNMLTRIPGSAGNADFRPAFIAGEFDGIGYKAHHDNLKHDGIAHHLGQRSDIPDNVSPIILCLQSIKHFMDQLVKAYPDNRHLGAPHP